MARRGSDPMSVLWNPLILQEKAAHAAAQRDVC